LRGKTRVRRRKRRETCGIRFDKPDVGNAVPR